MRTTLLIGLALMLLVSASPAAAAFGDSNLSICLCWGWFWYLANFSFMGMRAQASTAVGWKILAFIVGFPGTLVTWLVVRKGSERAYGVALPRRREQVSPTVGDGQ